jgi:hypothetical protein
MRNIDLNQLFIAAPGDQTEYFVRILIQCSVNAAILPEIDVGSGIIISKSAPTDVDKILFNSLRYPELIAQTRSEIPDSTIVCIMLAEDDATTIAKMTYHIFWKSEIQTNPESAIAMWPELSGITSDPVLCEAAFMSNVFTKCSPNDWISTDTSAADLTIDFKTVMGLDTKDLNQIICDFLQIPRRADLDAFIQQFRTINQKYLSY